MNVTQIKSNIIEFEYKQDHNDKNYGSCLWARFYFNLDKGELLINSDRGNYAHAWPETDQQFIELMAHVTHYYFLEKLYGEPKEFDYEKTKKDIFDTYDSERDKKALTYIFKSMDETIPLTANEFILSFDNEKYLYDWDATFDDTYVFECIRYKYSADIIKICEIFETYIQPELKKLLEV